MSEILGEALEFELTGRVTRIPSDRFPLAEYETVKTYADLLISTADRVHVLDISDGPFGIQGDCWFEKADILWDNSVGGYSTAYAHRTSDGAVMVACTDQVPPPPPNFPVLSLGDCIGTYYRNADLVYGSKNTLFSDSAEAIDGKFQIDCASFVDATLGGITYEHSRYVLGTNKENIYGAYVGDNYLKASTRPLGSRTHSLGAIKQAEWFAQQKRLFKLPLETGDYRDAVHKLRPGDVLFSGAATETGSNPYNPYEIGHVQIVLAVFDNGVVLAAEGGGGPHNLDTTASNVCKLETIDLKRQYGRAFKTVRVFARPNYGGLPESLRPIAVTSIVKANNGDPIASQARSEATHVLLATVNLSEPLKPGKVYTLTITGRLPSGTPIWMPNGDGEPVASKQRGANLSINSGLGTPALITTFGMPFHNEMTETVSIPFVHSPDSVESTTLLIYARESPTSSGIDADGNPYTGGIGNGEQEYQIQSVELTRGLGRCAAEAGSQGGET